MFSTYSVNKVKTNDLCYFTVAARGLHFLFNKAFSENLIGVFSVNLCTCEPSGIGVPIFESTSTTICFQSFLLESENLFPVSLPSTCIRQRHENRNFPKRCPTCKLLKRRFIVYLPTATRTKTEIPSTRNTTLESGVFARKRIRVYEKFSKTCIQKSPISNETIENGALALACRVLLS